MLIDKISPKERLVDRQALRALYQRVWQYFILLF